MWGLFHDDLSLSLSLSVYTTDVVLRLSPMESTCNLYIYMGLYKLVRPFLLDTWLDMRILF